MRKTFKIIIISLILVLAINTITSNAASINMNLEAENAVTDENPEESTNSTDTNTVSNTTNTTSNTTSTDSNSGTDSATVTNLSSLPESELGLSNIINILLIAVGVILIFLAIAILIRLAHK